MSDGFQQPPLRIDPAETGVPIEAMSRGIARDVEAAHANRQPGEPPVTEVAPSPDEIRLAPTTEPVEGVHLVPVRGSVYVGFETEGEGYQTFPIEGAAVASRYGTVPPSPDAYVERAIRRGQLDETRAAAEMRAAGWPLASAYGALMTRRLAADEPAGDDQTAVLRVLRDVYAARSAAVVLQRAGGRPTSFTARELMSMHLPPPRWLVEGVIPEGVTLLAGKPKQGKSRFTRNVAVALASGGRALGAVPVDPMGVLYLHLEGGLAGVRQDVLTLCGGDPVAVPEALAFETDWPRGVDGVEALGRYFEAHEACRLVVIDTLKLFRTDPTGSGSMYDEDYAATVAISKMCQRWGVNALIVHHASKRTAEGVEDVLDLISGSTGLVAGVDNGAVLAKTSQGVVLAVRPRDLEGVDLAVEWDDALATWRVMGDAAVHNASERQRRIYDVIKDSRDELQAYEIAQILEIDAGTIRKELHRMRQKSPPLVEQRGKVWVLASRPLSEQEAEAWRLEGHLPPGVEAATPEAPTEGPGREPPF